MTEGYQGSFSDFNLRPALLRAVERKGFEHPMPVQTAVLEDESLIENDIIVQAKTGSGKTLAFALPLLNITDESKKLPQILVLSPTRELAQQTAREFAWLGSDLGIRTAALVGGLDMERQIRSLREGAAVTVGTPGRVLDHIRRGTLRTEEIHSVVLDEGDHMLDMGFRDELEAILEAVGSVDRTWLFSATMPDEVLSLANSYLDAPRKISLVTDITTHSEISQRAYIIPSRKRFEGLTNVLIWEAPSKALIFCGTRAETQEIADRLCDNGFHAAAIHGDMSQRERNGALSALRGGRVAMLVATDVAARGLDIDAVSHVIQYGMPQNLEAFVHRSGRTGRAGREGSNLILLTSREAHQFRGMIAHSGSKLKLEWIPAPDAAEIDVQSRVRFENNIIEHALESDEFAGWAQDLLSREEAPVLVSGLLAKAYGDQPSGYSIRADVQAEMDREKGRRSENRSKNDRADRFKRADMTGGASVHFSQGRDDGWEVGPLLGTLCRCLGIGREDVGNIKLRDSGTSVELSQRGAEMLEERLDRLSRFGLSVVSAKPISGQRRTDGRTPRDEKRFSRDREQGVRRGKERNAERQPQRGSRKRFGKKD